MPIDPPTAAPTPTELLQESALSLDAPVELAPYLGALFSDLDDLGVRSVDVLRLLQKADAAGALSLPPHPRGLDLGCGKGAVVRALANAWDIGWTGVDANPAFVTAAEATEPANATFLCADLHAVVADTIEASLAPVSESAGNADSSVLFDLVTLFAMGEVFGGIEETVATLRACAVPGGLIAFDDAIARKEDAALPQGERLWTLSEANEAFAELGVEVVAQVSTETPENRVWLSQATASLIKRADALAQQHPQDARILNAFAARQRDEIEEMADAPVEGVLWLLRV